MTVITESPSLACHCEEPDRATWQSPIKKRGECFASLEMTRRCNLSPIRAHTWVRPYAPERVGADPCVGPFSIARSSMCRLSLQLGASLPNPIKKPPPIIRVGESQVNIPKHLGENNCLEFTLRYNHSQAHPWQIMMSDTDERKKAKERSSSS